MDKDKKSIILLIGLLLTCLFIRIGLDVCSCQDYILDDKEIKVLSNNGVTEWFQNKYSSIDDGQFTYFGFTNNDGKVLFKIYDENTNEFGEETTIKDYLTADDHECPALLKIDNQILIFYTHHDTPLFFTRYFISNSSFSSEISVDTDNISYPQPILRENGDIWVFYRVRNSDYDKPFAYRISNDSGTTWSNTTEICADMNYNKIFYGWVTQDSNYAIHVMIQDVGLSPINSELIGYMWSEDGETWKKRDNTEIPLPANTTTLDLVYGIQTKYFDLGTLTSPVASGYTRIVNYASGQIYNSSIGYGWINNVGVMVDRGTPATDLLRDFIYCTTAFMNFSCDLPNSQYTINITFGDKSSLHDYQLAYCENELVGNVSTAYGVWQTISFDVILEDNQLSLSFKDGGGADGACCVNAIVIIPIGATLWGYDLKVDLENNPLITYVTNLNQTDRTQLGFFAFNDGSEWISIYVCDIYEFYNTYYSYYPSGLVIDQYSPNIIYASEKTGDNSQIVSYVSVDNYTSFFRNETIYYCPSYYQIRPQTVQNFDNGVFLYWIQVYDYSVWNDFETDLRCLILFPFDVTDSLSLAGLGLVLAIFAIMLIVTNYSYRRNKR